MLISPQSSTIKISAKEMSSGRGRRKSVIAKERHREQMIGSVVAVVELLMTIITIIIGRITTIEVRGAEIEGEVAMTMVNNVAPSSSSAKVNKTTIIVSNLCKRRTLLESNIAILNSTSLRPKKWASKKRTRTLSLRWQLIARYPTSRRRALK